MTHERRTPLNPDADVQRRLNELNDEIARLRADTTFASTTALSSARILRVSAKARWQAEAQAGWDRLAPPVGLVAWHPRQAPRDTPDVAQSLIDRLKAGEPTASSMVNTTANTVVSYREAIQSLGPIAYWRLGEVAGTVAADATGHGYTGTYVGNPTLGVAGALAGDRDTAMTL